MPGTLLTFLGVAALLSVTPGPNMVYVISRSVAQGSKAGLASLAGVMVGYLFYLFGAAFGIAAFFKAYPFAAKTMGALGAVYLAWLAWEAIRPGGRSPLQVNSQLPQHPTNKLIIMGAATSLLNPKLALIFLTLLPQFIDEQQGEVLFQSLLYGGILVAMFATVNACMAVFSGKVAEILANRPKYLLVQRMVMGFTLLALAIRMALDALA